MGAANMITFHHQLGMLVAAAVEGFDFKDVSGAMNLKNKFLDEFGYLPGSLATSSPQNGGVIFSLN